MNLDGISIENSVDNIFWLTVYKNSSEWIWCSQSEKILDVHAEGMLMECQFRIVKR